MHAIAVYCGSRFGNKPQYKDLAIRLGTALAHQKYTLVYGGGSVGLMGALADASLAADGHVIGVITEHLHNWEVAHQGLPQLEIVTDMHVRKARMETLSDGFILLPGGIGSFEEFFEILTWQQLQLHTKPIYVLDDGSFYQPLKALMIHSVNEGFLSQKALDSISWHSNVDDLMEQLKMNADKKEL